MADFMVKRSVTNLNKIRVIVYGPIEDPANLGPSLASQPVKFDKEDGNVAAASLEPGKFYAIDYELIGDRGGKIELSLKRKGTDGPYKPFGSAVTVPDDHAGKQGRLGYTYTTITFPKVPEAAS